MLAKIGQAAKRYSTDHSGESVPVADHHAVNAAVASTGLEISVTLGSTDQDTFDSMIVDLCPQFARPDQACYFATFHKFRWWWCTGYQEALQSR